MTDQIQALAELHNYFSKNHIRYATIGGLAAAVWGEPRPTHDADVTVAVPFEKEDEFLRDLAKAFSPRIPEAADFARRARVVLLRASNGCPVDVALGLPGYQEQMIERAQLVTLEPGVTVPVCRPEDLVIHKVFAGREHDERDVLAVFARQGSKLDIPYMRLWVRQFDDAVGHPETSERFERLLARWEKERDDP